MVENLVPVPSAFLWFSMVNDIFFILDADNFTFLLVLPIPSQNSNSMAYPSLVLCRVQFLSTNLWDTPSFPIYFVYLLTAKFSPV